VHSLAARAQSSMASEDKSDPEVHTLLRSGSELSLSSSSGLLAETTRVDVSSNIGSPGQRPTASLSAAGSKHAPQGTEFLVLVANRLHFSRCYVYFYLFMFILNTFAIVWVRSAAVASSV